MLKSHKALRLVDPDTTSYKLHPVVVFSILDHYKRRGEKQQRVIGALIGNQDGNVISISDSFPVPHNETDETLVMDMEYYDNMLGLHLKVNSGQKVVGYYSTGSKIDYISSLMHNGFARQVSDPVLVTIDVELKDFQMAVKGYTGSPVADNVLCKFLPVDLQLTSYDAEKIGVDALINGNPEDTYLDAPASILSDIDNLEMSLGQLLQNIETVSDYVQDVVEKKVEGDAEVGLKLAEALSAIPSVDRDVFNKAFNGSVQDLLVVQYLVQLTGAQITLADKIQGLL